jgi:hypothetical protein
MKTKTKPLVTSKICTHCHLEKSGTEFYNSPYSADGKLAWCRNCHSEKTSLNAKARRLVAKETEECRPKRPSIRLMSSTQLADMRSRYEAGETMKDLAKDFGVSHSTIRLYLKHLGVEIRSLSLVRRKYRINENYFDTINSQEKAYFLGLLYADGCNTTNEYEIRLGLQTKDKALVERLRDVLFPDGRPLRHIKSHIDKKGMKCGEMWELTVRNKHMSGMLERHGMVARKTFVLAFPEWLRPDLVPHFIRGYNDGDGCIESAYKQQCRVELLGTREFCEGVVKSIPDTEIRTHIYPRGSIYDLVINGRYALQFLDWIYAGSTIHFLRKHEKYLELKRLQAQRSQARFHRKCSLCDRKHYAKGFCQYHYCHQKHTQKQPITVVE